MKDLNARLAVVEGKLDIVDRRITETADAIRARIQDLAGGVQRLDARLDTIAEGATRNGNGELRRFLPWILLVAALGSGTGGAMPALLRLLGGAP